MCSVRVVFLDSPSCHPVSSIKKKEGDRTVYGIHVLIGEQNQSQCVRSKAIVIEVIGAHIDIGRGENMGYPAPSLGPDG